MKLLIFAFSSQYITIFAYSNEINYSFISNYVKVIHLPGTGNQIYVPVYKLKNQIFDGTENNLMCSQTES
jgi:hypothetical protein